MSGKIQVNFVYAYLEKRLGAIDFIYVNKKINVLGINSTLFRTLITQWVSQLFINQKLYECGSINTIDNGVNAEILSSIYR